MTVTLVSEQDRRLIATRRFDQMAMSASTDTPDLIPAFDAAMQQVLTKVVDWTLARSR